MDQKNSFDPDALWLEAGGDSHYLGSWAGLRRDGRAAPYWELAATATAVTANWLDVHAGIQADARRSDKAKKDDSRSTAMEALRELGAQQARLTKLGAQLDADRQRLAKVAPADAAQTLVDLALAERLRNLRGDERAATIARLVSGADPRTVEAVLRLPLPLTGLAPEAFDAIAARAVERNFPDEVRELQQLGETLRTTQLVLDRTAAHLIDKSELELADMTVSLGAAGMRHVPGLPRDPEVRAVLLNKWEQEVA